MTQTLDIGKSSVARGAPTRTYEKGSGLGAQRTEQETDRFVAELWRMTSQERISASRYTMKRWEYTIYAARFPEEAPTVNGELERIAATLE